MCWFGRKRDPQDANEVLRRYNEVTVGTMAGLLLRDTLDIARGDVIRTDASA